MRLLIIGPFPEPINGCSLANEVLLKQAKLHKNISVNYIDTNSREISSKHVGMFSFTKVFSFIKTYKSIFYINKADVVYITPGQTFYGVVKYMPFFLNCLLFGKPYLIHIHGNHLGNEYKSLQGFRRYLFSIFLKKASAGIVLSDYLKSNFEGLLNPEKIFIVENFAQDDLVQEVQIEKPKDMLRLLYLSNLMEEKGIIDFLDCLILLKENKILFTADIAGNVEDKCDFVIRNKFKELQGHIKYHGVVTGIQKKDLLEKANIFILPTYYRMEGQPISIIEAMATGNIILTTNFSGIPDIVSRANGYFIQPKNPKNIYDRLLEINQDLAKNIDSFSYTNMEYVKSNFTENQFSNKIIKLVQQLLQ
ncbi:glycosyltransferase family 4 protein [Flavobacterium aquiphilum]|uniref:glycosyltransferase family 4 protein n=1 Tax=Flavobacterium aquiphilum TaxID=3003261 RepID=UPI00247FDF44|nr:glycosyltransferase family 4 protein [Flavobacterium aquiphilum]